MLHPMQSTPFFLQRPRLMQTSPESGGRLAKCFLLVESVQNA